MCFLRLADFDDHDKVFLVLPESLLYVWGDRDGCLVTLKGGKVLHVAESISRFETMLNKI